MYCALKSTYRLNLQQKSKRTRSPFGKINPKRAKGSEGASAGAGYSGNGGHGRPHDSRRDEIQTDINAHEQDTTAKQRVTIFENLILKKLFFR